MRLRRQRHGMLRMGHNPKLCSWVILPNKLTHCILSFHINSFRLFLNHNASRKIHTNFEYVIILRRRGLMVEIRTCNPKVASSSLGPAGIVGGGSEWTVLSPPQLQHKWLPTAPGVCSRCVCAFWMGQMQSTNSEHGLPCLAVCHVTFTFF